MIKLYHGSNVPIFEIDLTKSRKGKDFGKGFYLNANPVQAMEMAVRTSRVMGEGCPIVSSFEFDETIAVSQGLKIKIFEDYGTPAKACVWTVLSTKDKRDPIEKEI